MERETVLVTISETSPEVTRVLLQGKLSIGNASTIKKKLTTALHNAPNIQLVFRNVINIDMSVLQLIVAMQKSAASLHKQVSLEHELPDNMKQAIKYAGLDKLIAVNKNTQPDGIH